MATRAQITAPLAEPQGLPLHLKYRPTSLDQLWGQDEVARSLKKALTSSTLAHSYLFTGPAGCGKTTLARIVGRMLNVADANIIEADAATNSGIDAMREITDTLRYKGFGGDRKLVILDEVHALSKSAWQSLLKVTEEPPEHVFFALCTTEAGKVPDTILSRCLAYRVQPLKRDDMLDFLDLVCKDEGIKAADAVLSEIVKVAQGGMRRALTALEMVRECKDAKEAAVVLSQPFESSELIDLCRAMVAGNLQWVQVRDTLKAVKEDDPEGLRLIIVNYLQAVIFNADEKKADKLLGILSEFMRPVNRSEKMAPLLLAFANVVMGR